MLDLILNKHYSNVYSVISDVYYLLRVITTNTKILSVLELTFFFVNLFVYKPFFKSLIYQ